MNATKHFRVNSRKRYVTCDAHVLSQGAVDEWYDSIPRKNIAKSLAKFGGRKGLRHQCVIELCFMGIEDMLVGIAYKVSNKVPPEPAWAKSYILNLGICWVGLRIVIYNR